MKGLYKSILKEVEEEYKNLANRKRNSKILIVDGLNTFIRSWTTNPTMNEDGEHTGGLVGTLRSIGYLIREYNPTRVIVVFDGKGGSSKRKKIFDGYKADRGKNRFRVNRQYPEMMNEEDESLSMKRQFVWLADTLNTLPITTMIYDGIEADDVIGYITAEVVKEGEEVVIVSTDKDFLQLVNDTTTVYSPTKKKLYSVDTVKEEYGIHPKNLLLFRTVDGDKSDNIPGVKGCGLKTFLKAFPEFENDDLINFEEFFNLSENKSGLKIYKNILDNKETILMNEKLMNLSEVKISTSDKLKILDRFNEDNKPFEKIEFLRVGLKYKILQNWKDINDWLQSTFSNIIVK